MKPVTDKIYRIPRRIMHEKLKEIIPKELDDSFSFWAITIGNIWSFMDICMELKIKNQDYETT